MIFLDCEQYIVSSKIRGEDSLPHADVLKLVTRDKAPKNFCARGYDGKERKTNKRSVSLGRLIVLFFPQGF